VPSPKGEGYACNNECPEEPDAGLEAADGLAVYEVAGRGVAYVDALHDSRVQPVEAVEPDPVRAACEGHRYRAESTYLRPPGLRQPIVTRQPCFCEHRSLSPILTRKLS